VLADRSLSISGATRQPGTDPATTQVTITITIDNRADRAIPNDAAFFQLTTTGGDAFAARVSAVDPFVTPIASGERRTGSVSFDVPVAAAEDVRLLYRPELPTESVVMPVRFR
jgi:hypothetical protein